MITVLHFGGGVPQMIAVDNIGGGEPSEKTQDWLCNTWTAPYEGMLKSTTSLHIR